MATLTSTIAWCTSCVESVHRAHCSTLDDDAVHFMVQVLGSHIVISMSSMAHFLWLDLSLYWSFLPFSVFFLYPELFLELDNPIVMANRRYSAAEESEDTLNSFTSQHKLWAQPPDLWRAQRLISSFLLHDPFHGPGRGWRDTRRDAHSGTPRTSRLLCTRRHVSQSVVVCNVRWIRSTWWRENGRSLKKIWCPI